MNKTKKTMLILLQIAAWLVVFLSPLVFMRPDEKVSFMAFIYRLPWPLSLFIVFYANYLFLAKELNKGKKVKYFIANVLIIMFLAFGTNYWNSKTWRNTHNLPKHNKELPARGKTRFEAMMTLRDVFMFAVVAALATSIIYANKLTEAEKARQEAEKARAEAELSNLRSQINPHFLLNTLNNIYALTSFNVEKAQKAILELSNLLRHLLYDNQQQFVNMKDEAEFLHNYVTLMKLRVSGSVEITEHISLPDPCYVRVAPMIFISLVENAFKHGISATEKSFIHINLSVDDSKIVCHIVNSNHPKTQKDRSGHGIGLELVRKRLELSYPGKYEWEVKLNENNEYSSKIIIYDTQLCNYR